MTNDTGDDKLRTLASLDLPKASPEARSRALAASLVAFDALAAEDRKENRNAPQGSAWLQRLRSIVPHWRGNWTMDMRIPVGTAAIALLMLPLGYQLYSSTAITPIGVPPVPRETVEPKVTQPVTPPVVAPASPPAASTENDLDTAEKGLLEQRLREDGELSLDAPRTEMTTAAPAKPEAVAQLGGAQPEIGRDALASTASGESYADALPEAMPAPTSAMPMESAAMRAPTYVAPPVESGDEFTPFAESPVKAVATEPVSTFSIDVDTASYSYVRRALKDGYLPEADAVRTEEMINYFSYNYPAPESAGTPFRATMAVYPNPWNAGTQLLHIGIKGYVPPVADRQPANLVFLIDTSGSMDEPDKLPLLQRSFSLLVDQLGPNDTVSIVTYAGSAGLVLEPTKAADRAKIMGSLNNLWAGGSTAGAEGIALAYAVAERAKIPGGVNRVILATDGDFNVGIDDPEELKSFIKTKRESGVFLSVLGFGRGNLDDATMQALAQNGNGNASYIDSFQEAQKVLVAEGGATLATIAKDVKIQIEFNPAVVSEYRLIGYETRALNREDFNNDRVDAGDIGAGHTVTAIYEIIPAGSVSALIDPLRYGEPAAPVTVEGGSREIGFLKMRYKLPEGDTSTLIEAPIVPDLVLPSLASAPDDMRFAAAVAAFSQKLRGSNYGEMGWAAIRQLAQGARGEDASGYRAEFLQLVDLAAALSPSGPETPCAGPDASGCVAE